MVKWNGCLDLCVFRENLGGSMHNETFVNQNERIYEFCFRHRKRLAHTLLIMSGNTRVYTPFCVCVCADDFIKLCKIVRCRVPFKMDSEYEQ